MTSRTTFILEVQDLSRQAFEAFKAGAAGAEAQLTDLQKEVASTSGTFAEFQNKLAAAAKFTKDLNFKVDSIGKSNADLVAMQAAQLGVTSTAAPMIAKLREVEAASQSGAMSAAMYTNALRQVPMQVTDIVTSLAAGQRPMTVLMQQGGQLKDVFGGIGPAAKALGGYVMGLVNPLTMGAAVVGALGYAWHQGSSESRAFQHAAIMSGNAVGLSASQYALLRDNLTGIAGTKGAAAKVLTEIAGSAKLAGANVLSIAEAATLMERALGQAVAKTVDQFEELRKTPLETSIKLNEQYNYLTASVYRQIKALEDQGRTVDAANLAERTYADAMKTRAQEVINNAGSMEKAWRGVVGVAKSAWDAMLGIGREMSPAEKLAAAAADVARIQAQIAGVGKFGETGGGAATGGASAARRAALEQELAAAQQRQAYAQEAVRLEQRSAESKAEQARLTQAAVGWEKIVTENADKQAKWSLEEKRIRAAGLADRRTEVEIAKQLAAARERILGGGKKGGDPFAAERDFAKEYAAAFKDFVKLQAEAEDKTNHLSKAQSRLVEYLSSPAYQAHSEAMRQIVLQQAYAAIGSERAGKAQAELQKQIEESAKAYEQFAKAQEDSERKGVGDILKRVADLKNEAETYGMLESQIQRVILARLEEARRGVTNDADMAALNAEIDARRKLLTQLDGKELRDANKKAADASAREWERVADAFVDNLMRGGKSVAQYLKDLFRTLVLRPMLAPVGQAVAGVIGGALGMPAAAQSLTGSAAGSAAGGIAGSSLFGGPLFGSSMLGTGLSTTMSNGLISGFGMNMTNVGNAFAGGQYMLGVGNAMPYIGAALAAISLLKGAFKGETRVGGQYQGASLIDSPSGGEIGGEQIRATIATTITSINDTLRQLGSDASVSLFRSGLEQSEKGKGFAYARGTLSTGQQFGNWNVDGYMQNRGSMTAEQAAAKFGEELKQATLQALQAADVPGQLSEYLRSLGDIEQLSGGALDAALARIQKALSEKATLEEQYFTLTHTDLENLTRAREKERNALDESNRALYDQIAALQDQKAAAAAAAQKQREIDQERAGLETRLLQLQGDTAELRRRELGALDPANRALQERIWALEDAAAVEERLAAANEREATRRRELLDSLTSGTDAAYAALERAIGAQRQAAQGALEVAQEQISAIKGLSDELRSEIRSLHAEVASTSAADAAAGNAFIDQALSTALATGYLPEQAALAEAVDAARGGMGSASYATAFELQRDQLVLAGKLSQLDGVASKALPVAERQLLAAKDQIKQLDETLEFARQQIDQLRGIDTSVISVREAVDRLALALAREAAGSGKKVAATEQWVDSPLGRVWQSSGGAIGLQNAAGLTISGITGDQYTADAARAWVDAQAAAGDRASIYAKAIEQGISANSLDKLMGLPAGYSNREAAAMGLPAFAAGGWHSGGWAMVGEEGPELAYMPPARIYSADQTSRMGNGNERLESEFRQLRTEQQAQARAQVAINQRMVKLLERWEIDGMPQTRTV